MLTKSEREWLASRSHNPWCDGHCPATHLSEDCYWLAAVGQCAVTTHEQMAWDAAEFGERVAAKLATEHENIMLNAGVCEACFAWGTCFNGFEENDNAFCAHEMLKAARIAVEEEMDGSR